jgi:hypothetical protein
MYRPAQNPQALAFVVASSSARTIHVFWSSYCEIESDDVMTDENQGTLAGVGEVTAYPPVLRDATLCYLSINAGAHGRARVAVAIFAY